jgi:phosphate transport system substrate-binding protein
MIVRHASLFLAAIGLLILAGCSRDSAGPSARAKPAAALSGKLLITGSSTMQPLMAEVAQRFQSLHPGVQIEVQAGGSGRGVSDARNGKADFGMASRALTDKESDLFGFPVGRDGIGILVHTQNPVKALTRDQVSGLYTGRVANWKELGGHDAAVFAVGAAPGHSSHELFLEHFKLRNEEITLHAILGDNPLRVSAVAENPNAIVYISLGEAERRVQEGVPVKLLPMDGVPATSRNIRNGNYPISRPLMLVTRELPRGLARTFIEFAFSAQVNDIVAQHDFIPYQE